MGVTTSPVDWYAARAAGIVAYLILTVVVLVGLALSGQLRLPHWPKFALTDVHRFGGLLVGVFVSMHIATIALDSYTPFSLTQLLVPFSSHYRPLWTALGIVAAELLAALAVTNTMRAKVPYRWWRRIHILNFAVWGAATVHGIGAGTDTPSTWMTLVYVVSVSRVLTALAWRLIDAGSSPGPSSRAAAAVLLGVAAWSRSFHAPRPQRQPRAVELPAPCGDLRRFAHPDRRRRPSAALDRRPRGGCPPGPRPYRSRDHRRPLDQGAALQLKDISTGSVCSGTVSAIGPSGFTGTCNFNTGAVRTVAATWELTSGHVTGNLTVTA